MRQRKVGSKFAIDVQCPINIKFNKQIIINLYINIIDINLLGLMLNNFILLGPNTGPEIRVITTQSVLQSKTIHFEGDIFTRGCVRSYEYRNYGPQTKLKYKNNCGTSER